MVEPIRVPERLRVMDSRDPNSKHRFLDSIPSSTVRAPWFTTLTAQRVNGPPSHLARSRALQEALHTNCCNSPPDWCSEGTLTPSTQRTVDLAYARPRLQCSIAGTRTVFFSCLILISLLAHCPCAFADLSGSESSPFRDESAAVSARPPRAPPVSQRVAWRQLHFQSTMSWLATRFTLGLRSVRSRSMRGDLRQTLHFGAPPLNCPCERRMVLSGGKCIDCPAGSYCPCWNQGNGLCQSECWSASEVTCPIGSFCLVNSTEPYSCFLGSCCTRTGLSFPNYQCRPGEYCPFPCNSIADVACQPGELCPDGYSKEDCPAGFYCGFRCGEASNCTIGSYCPVKSQTDADCGAGFVCVSTTSKVPCRNGSFCGYNRTVEEHDCGLGFACATVLTRLPCVNGTYCNSSRMQYPVNCPQGFECPVNSTEHGCVVPVPCPNGTYCPPQTFQKTDCGLGFFCRNTWTREVCPNGTYCNDTRLTQSIPCPAGFFCRSVNNSIGSIEPHPCPAGSWCAANSSKSTICDAGHYCPAESPSQTPCDLTFYCPRNSSQQTLCRPAFMCPNASVQLNCSIGSYCPEGSINGIPCEPGYYCPAPNDTQTPCWPGTFSNISSAKNCTLCRKDTFSKTQAANSSTICEPCGVGFETMGTGSTTCSQCLRGYIGRKDGCIKCTTSKGCKGNTFCDVGYVGPSGRTPCDLCAPGFYNPTTGTTDVIECKECAATKAWVLVVAVLLLLLLALVIVWFNKIPLLQRVGLPLRNGLVYIQVVSLLKLVNLRWPSAAHKALIAVGITMIRLDVVIQPACLISFETNFFVRLGFPLGFGVVLFLYYCSVIGLRNWYLHHRIPADAVPNFLVRWLYPKLGRRPLRDDRYPRRMKALLFRSWLSFLSFTYVYLSEEAFAVYDCIDIEGVQRMRDFVRVRCSLSDSDWSGKYLPMSVFSILAYTVGIPATELWLLNYLECGAAPGAKRYLPRATKDFAVRFRWWDAAGLVWRLAIVLILRFLQSNLAIQLTLFLLLLTVRLVAQRVWRPYTNPLITEGESYLVGCTFAVIISGVIFFIWQSQSVVPNAAEAVLYVIAIGATAGLFLCTMYSVYRVWQEYRVEKSLRLRGAFREVTRERSRSPDSTSRVNGPPGLKRDNSGGGDCDYVELAEYQGDGEGSEQTPASADLDSKTHARNVSGAPSDHWSEVFDDSLGKPLASPSLTAMDAYTPNMSMADGLDSTAAAAAASGRSGLSGAFRSLMGRVKTTKSSANARDHRSALPTIDASAEFQAEFDLHASEHAPD